MNDDQRKQRAVVRDSAEAEVTDMCLFSFTHFNVTGTETYPETYYWAMSLKDDPSCLVRPHSLIPSPVDPKGNRSCSMGHMSASWVLVSHSGSSILKWTKITTQFHADSPSKYLSFCCLSDKLVNVPVSLISLSLFAFIESWWGC